MCPIYTVWNNVKKEFELTWSRMSCFVCLFAEVPVGWPGFPILPLALRERYGHSEMWQEETARDKAAKGCRPFSSQDVPQLPSRLLKDHPEPAKAGSEPLLLSPEENSCYFCSRQIQERRHYQVAGSTAPSQMDKHIPLPCYLKIDLWKSLTPKI